MNLQEKTVYNSLRAWNIEAADSFKECLDFAKSSVNKSLNDEAFSNAINNKLCCEKLQEALCNKNDTILEKQVSNCIQQCRRSR